jgi:hypothetical protein
MNKKIIKIGLDLDGCISNWSKRFSEVARIVFGEHLPLVEDESQIKAWDWTKWYPLTKKEISMIWDEVDKIPKFWETLEVLNEDDFKSLVDFTNKYQNEVVVYFITNRHETPGKNTHLQTVNCLKKNGIENPQVIVIRDKASIIKDLQIDYFVDDNSDNIKDVLAQINVMVNMQTVVFLKKALYNNCRYDDCRNRLIKVDKVSEMLNYIVEKEGLD